MVLPLCSESSQKEDTLAYKVGYIRNENEKSASYEELYNGIIEIERQLAGFIRSLRE